LAVNKKDQVRLAAEADLAIFIQLVHPQRVLGEIHFELIKWWTRPDAKSHQLTLLPRDHQKSALVAYRVAWEIVKNPAIRILYISSTANLAVKQLKFIKDILTSDPVRFYWPELVNTDESKREKWTETEFAVDHPLRKAEVIRDPTVFTGGLTTSLTGMHCDITVMDDVVVIENAYTDEGRTKVSLQYSLLASIEGTEARGWIVGTRYHPQDLYTDLCSKKVETYDAEGDILGSDELYEVFERVVEDSKGRDGSGAYIWPRQKREDGKWYGFNQNILAKKRSQYSDRTQFYAQYYNDPNQVGDGSVSPECFQYYDPKYLSRFEGKWLFKGRRLNIFAAVDFAFSLNKRADYTAIVVVGIDPDNNYYVLDIDRFKATVPSEYFKHLLALHQKWDFRKIRCEVTAAQIGIVNSLKMDYIRPHGLALSVEEYRPNRNQGNKEERIAATLQAKYDNRQIWHFQGGNTSILEEELIQSHPTHDDVKDALASAVDAASGFAPASSFFGQSNQIQLSQMTHSRFGGIL
jgi:phage terminase large subunit-like protein